MIDDKPKFQIQENIVLEKFEGDEHPDNLVERVYLENGKIVKHEFIEDGAVTDTKIFDEGGN